ncbi:hypothetical protein [Actinotalea solisilvae]|uniref:hypothetical protein n=1 Tax=Actinotalea solisilvae TaxID=2072922 RepID=UPI0018F1C5DE|nr:hypothetical protein [Actinotalea solisilvae]
MDVPLSARQRAAAAQRVAEAEERRRRLDELGVAADARVAEEERTTTPVPPEVRREISRRLAEHPRGGCAVCERRAYTGDHEPYLLESVVQQVAVWRCSVCGTWWEEMPHEVHALTDDEVRRLYGDRLPC